MKSRSLSIGFRKTSAIAAFSFLFLSISPLEAQVYSTIPLGSPVATNQPDQSSSSADNSDSSAANSAESQTGYSYPTYQPVEIKPNSGTSADTSVSATGNVQDGTQRNGTIDAFGKTLSTPAEPGEFERYVENRVGRKIKRFGSELLIKAERDFALPSEATVPPDYALNIGDVVSISLTGSVEGSANFTIDRDGKIFLPKVGSVSLVGVRYRDLRDRIADSIGRQYRGYDVSVSIKKLSGVRVYVTGFANHPGSFTVNSLSTLVNAVLAAGGPNGGGSFRSVELIRNGQKVADFDLYELLRAGSRANDPVLQNEDVIFIPPVGEQVAVVGSINDEAIYEARSGETIADVLRFAGGPTALADNSRLVLYRLSESATVGSRQIGRAEMPLSPVENGDILQILSEGSLSQPLERQSVVVRIEGEVNHPGNYFVPPGTSLSEVLAKAGGLTSRAYVYGTQLTRESVRQQQRRSFGEALDQMQLTLAAAPLTDHRADSAARPAETAAAQAVIERLRNARPDGRLVLSIPYESAAPPGELVLENNDHIYVPPLIRTVGVFGAVYRPASFRLSDANSTERVKDFIERAGGTEHMADKGNIFVVRANGDVLTRKRGALSAHVRPGDVIFVPVKVRSYSLLEKLRDISSVVFQLGLGAAAVAAIQ